jgi:osmotically-inducible protein OsmY
MRTGMKHDETIRKNVMDEIQGDPQLTPIASQIGVIVKNEAVTLSGTVDYYAQKLAAEQAAKRVKDVKVVAVDINVKSAGFSDITSDSAIADAVRNALLWHSAVNEDKINVKVEDGWITLDGVVDWEYERKAAQRAVEHLRGVMGVINRVTIRARKVEPTEIKKKIRAAFHRHATVDSAQIHVTTQGDHVTLTGSVRSWTERHDAEDVAWSIPGVTTVENKLEVENSVFAD